MSHITEMPLSPAAARQRRLNWADALIVVAAGAILLALLLPWLAFDEATTYTGFALLTETQENTGRYEMLLAVLPISGAIGLAGLGIGWVIPSQRRRTPIFAFAGGLVGILYFVLFSIVNLQNPEATGLMGVGFWAAFVGVVVLALQIFIPRPSAERSRIARWRQRAGLIFLMPGVLWVLLFTIFPLLYSLVLAFTNLRLGRRRETDLVGLDNFARIFTDIRIQDVLPATLTLVVGSLILTLLLGTFIAWLFNHDIPGIRAMRAILTMPLFAAPIALGYLGVVIFNETNGPINHILRGLGGTGVSWFTEPWAARGAVLITDVWQWTPFVFIVVLAAMQSIPDELIEAARLDTTSGWQIFRSITFPLIAPALGTVALLRLVETWKILDIPITLTGGGPGAATQTYTYYAYLTGLRDFEMGYGSALAYVLVIIAIIISSVYFWRVRARFE